MKVVMSKKDVLEKGAALSKLVQEKMDFKLSYRLSKIAKKVLKICQGIERDRLAWVNEMGEKQEDGSVKVVKNLSAFQALYDGLMGEEVELEFEQIPRGMFDTCSCKLSPMEAMGIEDFLTAENTPE